MLIKLFIVNLIILNCMIVILHKNLGSFLLYKKNVQLLCFKSKFYPVTKYVLWEQVILEM